MGNSPLGLPNDDWGPELDELARSSISMVSGLLHPSTGAFWLDIVAFMKPYATRRALKPAFVS